MDYESESPLDAQLPRTTEERTAELEEAMNNMHVTFEKEVSKLHKTLVDMHASHRAEMQTIGLAQGGHGHGNSHHGQAHHNARYPVKAIGDVRRTMHAICQIPKLSHATLSDFDQWKQEMQNTITSARTDEPKYNQVNIEFIYASIALDLRDQAGGLEPAGLKMIVAHHAESVS